MDNQIYQNDIKRIVERIKFWISKLENNPQDKEARKSSGNIQELAHGLHFLVELHSPAVAEWDDATQLETWKEYLTDEFEDLLKLQN